MPYKSLLELPLQKIARSLNDYVVDIIDAMGPECFSTRTPKEKLKENTEKIIYSKIYNISLDYAKRNYNKNSVVERQERAFHHLAIAVLTGDNRRKAKAYDVAGKNKRKEAKLLNEETHRQQKAAALSQSAFYFNEAATWYTDDYEKAEAYYNAGKCKREEVELLADAQRVEAAKEAQKLFNALLMDNAEPEALVSYSIISFQLSLWDPSNRELHLDAALRMLENAATKSDVAITEKQCAINLVQGILESFLPHTRQRGINRLKALGSWAEQQTTAITLEILGGTFSLEDMKKGSDLLEDPRVTDFFKRD